MGACSVAVLAFGTRRVSPAKGVDMPTAQADIVNELRILRAAGNHKHITSYLGCAQRHGMLYVVMEWMAQGSLLAVLKRRSLTLKEVRDTGRDAMTCAGRRGSSHAGVRVFTATVLRDRCRRRLVASALPEHYSPVCQSFSPSAAGIYNVLTPYFPGISPLATC